MMQEKGSVFHAQSLQPGVSVFKTLDQAQAQSRLSSRYQRHRLRNLGQGNDFSFRHLAAAVPEGSFNLLSYGSLMEIEPEPFDDFFMLEMPLSGGVDIQLASGEHYQSDPHRALLIGPKMNFVSTWRRQSVQLMLKIRAEQMHSRWRQLVGEPAMPMPLLSPEIDLQTNAGWRVQQLLLLLHAELKNSVQSAQGSLSTSTLGSAVIDALIAYLIAAMGPAFSEARSPLLPAPLKRCTRFIDANLAGAIATYDLPKIAGISERSLYNQFRHFLGVTPQVYIRQARLQKSRALLLTGQCTVFEAARLAGFNHMGRFASQYKSHFGEAPSATKADSASQSLHNCPLPEAN